MKLNQRFFLLSLHLMEIRTLQAFSVSPQVRGFQEAAILRQNDYPKDKKRVYLYPDRMGLI